MNEICCSKCDAVMEKGQYIRNGFGMGVGMNWTNELEFKKSKRKPFKPLRTFQYRCPNCGLIETYAEPKESE